ncbi:MAG: hypothetical protein JO212_12655, partial [Acetobacteraceae bacterium]|nr:hypothetical protein [Acetobacteraceae bacterium]
HEPVGFTLPETVGGECWQLLIDTNLPDDAEMASYAAGQAYAVMSRSLLLLAREDAA